MEIIDFSSCPFSNRHGRYGGQAGDKDGIIYDGSQWIIKYPKSIKHMSGEDLNSYTSSPLSEYIGSHIYEILGFPVHQTLLGIRNGKLVVACKDFQEHMGDLAEIRTVKNAANKELGQILEEELDDSVTGDSVNLNELLLHFDKNPMMQRDDLKQRFWDCVVIDMFIDNSDRNNGNWGLLWNESDSQYQIAPVYDNGNAFETKKNDVSLKRRLLDNSVDVYAVGGRTAYIYNEKLLSMKKMLKSDFPELRNSLRRNVPIIKQRFNRIKNMIEEIPEKYEDIDICSQVRKEYYIRCLLLRLEALKEASASNNKLDELQSLGAARFNEV